MAHRLDIDRAVLRLAESQHGVVARRQLLELGVGADAIVHRRRIGRLVALDRGVYALGHRALRPQGLWMTAILACGPGAVLSHRSAARVWGIRPHEGIVELTVPGHGGRRADARRVVHRSATLDGWTTEEGGVPVTNVPRTLIDLAAVVPAHHLRRAVERAEHLELFDGAAVARALEAHERRPGTRALRALLADFARHGLTLTRSDTESLFLQLCLDHGIERPLVNRHAGGREVDFRWPARGLIVEVDGYGPHRSRRAFRRDRARDRAALREGLRTARFTAYEIERAPASVAAEVAALLRR